ncbi:MAG: class I SAM-dependent methyltransferase [Archangium sp.]|nr:class I SAM-dependent methyltransferase [Archangium sp.]
MTPGLYDAHDKLEENHWWFEGRRRVVREVMQRHVLPRAQRKILDVGCGAGGMFPLLSDFGSVDGAEASPDALARARLKYPLRRIESCSLPDELPKGTWDLITAFDVIEHLDEPIAALRTMRSRLTWDGQVVITVPAFQFLWSHHDDANQHRRRYSRLELVSHLSSAGLKVTYVSYFNTLLFPAVAAARLLARVRPKKNAEHDSGDLEETPEPLNQMLKLLFSSERLAVKRTSLPFGVSLIAVAQRG